MANPSRRPLHPFGVGRFGFSVYVRGRPRFCFAWAYVCARDKVSRCAHHVAARLAPRPAYTHTLVHALAYVCMCLRAHLRTSLGRCSHTRSHQRSHQRSLRHVQAHRCTRLCAHPPTACVARGHAPCAPNTYMCPPKIFTCAHPKRVHEENHRWGGPRWAPGKFPMRVHACTLASSPLIGRPRIPHVYAHEESWARDFSRVTGSVCAST